MQSSGSKKLWARLIYLLGFLVGWTFFYHGPIFSGFNRILGDGGIDPRLILRIQEHWYRFLCGEASWRDLGMFFPETHSLGYSDVFFLYAIGHSFFRILGFDIYNANLANYTLLAFIGYAGMVKLLRRHFGVRWAFACWGGAMFLAFSPIISAAVLAHPQMLTAWLLPWVVVFGVRAWERGIDPKARWSAWRPAALAGLLMAGVVYNAFYTSWFFILQICLILLILFLCKLFHLGGSLEGKTVTLRASLRSDRLCSFILSFWSRREILMVTLVCFAVGLVPFFFTYLPVLRNEGSWGWPVAKASLPRLADLLNSSEHNWIWKDLDRAILGKGGFRPNRHFGLPLISAFLFLLAAGELLWRGKKLLGSRSSFSADVMKAALASIVLGWLLMIDWGGWSYWKWIYQYVPGANAIRVVYRFNSVLVLPALILMTLFLDRRWDFGAIAWKKVFLRAFVVVLAGFALAEQWMILPDKGYEAFTNDQLRQKWDQIPPSPKGFETFFAVPYSDGRWGMERISALDAWAVSQRDGIPTINGFSGIVPTDYRLLDSGPPLAPSVFEGAVANWLMKHDYQGPLLRLNLESREWSVVEHPMALIPLYSLGVRIAGGTKNRRAEDGPLAAYAGEGWSNAESEFTWTDGYRATLNLRLEEVPLRDLVLVMEASAFRHPKLSEQRFQLKVNGTIVAEFQFKPTWEAQKLEFVLPASLFSDVPLLHLEIEIPGPGQPAEFDPSVTDSRRLGMAIRWLELWEK